MNIPFAFLLALASKRAFPTRYTKGCGRKIAALFLFQILWFLLRPMY